MTDVSARAEALDGLGALAYPRGRPDVARRKDRN
jgi:hypothetical protein